MLSQISDIKIYEILQYCIIFIKNTDTLLSG
jgi:hypothetical protein